MKGVNKVILVGNLGKDPEVQYLEGGVALARLPLATTESYKDRSGNWVDQTEWHNVVMWRMLAERAEKYLKKGSRIYVEGKIRTRSWEDREGNKKYTTEVVADSFLMLDSKPARADASPAVVEEKQDVVNDAPNDDLPF